MTVVVVAGGNNDNRFAVIDFSVPGSPTQVLATPAFTGGCWVDRAGTLAAAANFNGGQVSIFDISNPPCRRSGAPTRPSSVGSARSRSTAHTYLSGS